MFNFTNRRSKLAFLSFALIRDALPLLGQINYIYLKTYGRLYPRFPGVRISNTNFCCLLGFTCHPPLFLAIYRNKDGVHYRNLSIMIACIGIPAPFISYTQFQDLVDELKRFTISTLEEFLPSPPEGSPEGSPEGRAV